MKIIVFYLKNEITIVQIKLHIWETFQTHN